VFAEPDGVLPIYPAKEVFAEILQDIHLIPGISCRGE